MKYKIFPFGQVERGAKVVIYGAGPDGQNFIKQVQNTQYCQILWVVDKRHEELQTWEGIEVKGSDSLKAFSEYDYCVVSTRVAASEQEICDTLLNEIGVPGQKIIRPKLNEFKWDWPEYNYRNSDSVPVLLCGIDVHGARSLKELLAEGINVNAIFDDSTGSQCTTIAGIQVLPLERIKDFSRNSIVYVSHLHKYAITDKLRSFGFTNIRYPHTMNHGIEMSYMEWHLSRKESYKEIIKENSAKIDAAGKLFKDQKSVEIFDAALDAWGNGNWARLESHRQPYVASIPSDIAEKEEDGVFVECGAYEGSSIQKLISEYNNNFKKIYAFEPGDVEFLITTQLFKNNSKVEIVQSAVCDIDGVLRFGETSTGFDAKINESDSGGTEVPSVSLDTFFSKPGKETPTYIRMDIEGAEVSALRGAKNLIQKHMPKLSISAYHRIEDYWEVPLVIAELSNNGYDLYFRHFFSWYDTMCIAVPKKS
ncbi:MAG: FkbM family methyltransferase [Defluviitaleaceae bacterium]|nr:FkbM family methyltransferase [Defluviitaleaceae bacterium]